MEVKFYFLSALLIFLLTVTSGKNHNSVVFHAINAVINEHFAHPKISHPGYIDIVCFGNETKEFSALMSNLVKTKSLNVRIKVRRDNITDAKFSTENGWYEDQHGQRFDKKFLLNESSIVFFDSVEKFKADARKVKWVHEDQRGQHLVHVTGLKTLDILQTLHDGFAIDKVNFLMNETKKSIDLVTGFMFTRKNCRVNKLRRVNRFDADSKKWENGIFYPKKYENFYGCELSISKSVEFWDDENGALMKLIFENKLNANLVEVNVSIFDYEDIDLTREQTIITEKYGIISTVSDAHKYDIITFAVSPGEPYTDLERMFMMFAFEVWIATAITLLIGLLTTLILNFIPDTVRKFVIGRDVRNPTMNLISIFLTGGQVQVPGRNFARFLLILFIIWSLIIRTCHQSKLYELLQADLRRPPVKTIDDLFESPLTLHDHLSVERMGGKDFEERLEKPTRRLVKFNIQLP